MDLFQRAQQTLRQKGFNPVPTTWAKMEVVVGKQRFFRWPWMASALHVNVFLVKARQVDFPDLTAFLEQATAWTAANHRGFIRGMQSGQAVVVIVFAQEATKQANLFASKAWLFEFARVKTLSLVVAGQPSCRQDPRWSDGSSGVSCKI